MWLSSSNGGVVMWNQIVHAHVIIQHTTVSPYIQGTYPLISVDASSLKFTPTALYRPTAPPQSGRAVQNGTGTKQKLRRKTQSSTYASWLSTTSFLLQIVAQPPPSSLCCQSHLHTIHPTWPRSTPYPPSTNFHHQHSSSHTVLIHSLRVSKPSQYSDPPYTPAPLHSSSSKWYSH